jgi:hypothetical protein
MYSFVRILQHDSADTGSLPKEDFFEHNPNYFQITSPAVLLLYLCTNGGRRLVCNSLFQFWTQRPTFWCTAPLEDDSGSAGIFKLLRSPGIDTKESILPDYVVGEPVRQPYPYSVSNPRLL